MDGIVGMFAIEEDNGQDINTGDLVDIVTKAVAKFCNKKYSARFSRVSIEYIDTHHKGSFTSVVNSWTHR